MQNKPRLSNFQIWNMSAGFLGIQFGWSLQMANMSAIYEILGATPDSLPILWLAAPLTGLLVQPLIGAMSDRTWTRLGRRRPYFLAGAIFATAALILMPYSTALWMAAILLWIMDTSVNVSMEPFRAFVADILPEEQRTKGFAMQALVIGFGSVVASALPYLLTHIFGMGQGAYGHKKVPDVVELSFHIGAAVYICMILWTVLSTKEYPPENIEALQREKETRAGIRQDVREIFQALGQMPATMRQLAWVQIFSWMGMFCMFLYYPVAVAHNVFGATDNHSAMYMEGIEWGGICFAAYSAACFAFSFFIPAVSKRLTRKGAHIFCLLCGAAGLCLTALADNPNTLLVLMVGVGIAFAGILALPYAILSGAIPQNRMGVYMGIFNFFITIPQILISLGFGWVMGHFLGDNRMAGVVFGGVCMAVAAVLVLRVRDVGATGAESLGGEDEDTAEPAADG